MQRVHAFTLFEIPAGRPMRAVWLFLVGACLSACAAESATHDSGGAPASAGNAGSGGSNSIGGSTTSGGHAGTTNTGGNATGGSTTGGTANAGTGGEATGGTASGGSAGAPASQCGLGNPVSQPKGTPPSLSVGQWMKITPPGICAGAHFGCMDIHVDPCNVATLYLTTDSEGMWKSDDAGATWSPLGDLPAPVSPGVIQINPQNPKQMYSIGGVRGNSMGFWTSTDGGATWKAPAGFTSKADNSADGWTNDVYDVKADPTDFKHVLITFHGPWNWTQAPGVLESTDGGNSWTRRMPPESWGTGDGVWFLRDSHTWLVGTQNDGFWRTTDSGGSWKKVSSTLMQHGGTAAFYSSNGELYVGALSGLLRSTDNGLSFTLVGPHTSDGYYAVIGDGKRLYTQSGNTGGNTTGPNHYLTSAENDGVTWTQYNSQTFSDGPYRMDYDTMNGIVYSANWNGGVWALKVQN